MSHESSKYVTNILNVFFYFFLFNRSACYEDILMKDYPEIGTLGKL